MNRLLSAAGALAVAILATGCSVQTYGSHMMGHRLSEGASRADVLANLGEPDSVYKNNDVEMLVYKGYRGANYVWIYSNLRRVDKVVVLSPDGIVQTAVDVEMGKGATLIAPPFLDATHPFRTTELTEGPENYKVDQ